MKGKSYNNFEKIYEKGFLDLSIDLLCSIFALSLLSFILSLFHFGYHYYYISFLLYLISVLAFLGIKGGKGDRGILVMIFPLLYLFLFFILILVDDYFLSIRPLVYTCFLFLMIEYIRIGFALNEFLKTLLKRKKNYKIVANFEDRNTLLGKVAMSLLHDIATPVSILSGSLELMERRKLCKNELNDIQQNIKIAVGQIDCILHSTDFLIKKTSSLTYFSLEDSIEEVISLLNGRLESVLILVEKEYLVDEKIWGDRNIFLRIFLNVFLNAIEELERRERLQRKIWVGIYKEGEFICVDVCDNGDGIDPRMKIMLENDDFVVSKKTQDIGSGLFFVKYAMEEVFEGKIRIDYCKEEQKNSFKLYFPIG